ncbi:MAG: hypothetical protein ACTSU5_01070 [Promethearchaeota archaeon]
MRSGDGRRQEFERISRTWILAVTGVLVGANAYTGIVGPLVAYGAGFLQSFDLAFLLVKGILLVAGLLFGATQLDNWVGDLVLGTCFYFSGEHVFDVLERPTSFTLAQTFWGAVALAGVVGLLLLVARLLLELQRIAGEGKNYFQPRSMVEGAKEHLTRGHFAGLALLAAIVPVGTLYLAFTNNWYAQQVTITPRDYQIQFRFWAQYEPDWYQKNPHGAQILDQFNRHNVTIQCTTYPLRDADGNLESFSPTVFPEDVNKCVSSLAWFRDNYPGIKFQYYAFGLGYGSCGNYEGSIYTPAMLKRFVDVCRNYSLPNVVGVYTDWEGPSAAGPDVSNETRNGWHQALWTDAMAYARAYFPDWTFSCCHPDATLWDGFDGDADLQYFDRYNIFTPQWDDYGPMVYRSCDAGTGWEPSDDGTWKVYSSAAALLNGALHGDVSRATMWLGCTGCGPYENTTTVYEHGEPMDFGDSRGFSAYARDVLVLKHFGFPSVSIFLGMGAFDDRGFQTGFFDQYGYDDALDRLDEIVNGPNSTESFTIWTNGNWSPGSPIAEDLLLDLDRLEFLPLLGGLVACGWLAASWKRETSKVGVFGKKKRGEVEENSPKSGEKNA